MTHELDRRTFLKRTGQAGGLITVGGTLASVLAACGGNVPTTPSGTGSGDTTNPSQGPKVVINGLKVPGQMQWGATTSGGAPFVFQDPNNPATLVGFEVEIADAMSKLMGLQARMVETDYPQLEAAIQSGKFDFIMNGWEVTEEREKTESFSEPYYYYGQQIVVRSDDSRFASKTATDDMTLKDLEGLTVGTGAGFKAADILATNEKITLKTYDPDLPFSDLALGRIDAILIDLPIVTYYALGAGPGGKADPRLKLVGKPFENSHYVIAVKKGDTNGEMVLKSVNEAVALLKEDGTLRKIYEKWKLWNDQQAQIGIK